MGKEIIKFDKNGSVVSSEPEQKEVDRSAYVEPDSSMLGDKHLDPAESVAREREALLSIRQKDKMYGHDELIEADRSEGCRLHYSAFIPKLKQICPQILVKDGSPGNIAIYVPKTEMEMLEGYDLLAPKWHNESKYVTGCPKEDLPEWGHLTTDTDGVANREVRGWRSMLIAFIKQKHCSYAAVVQEFGEPEDSRSRLWHEQLYECK